MTEIIGNKLTSYIEDLVTVANNHLIQFNLSNTDFQSNDFSLINFYLVEKAINESINLFIQTSNQTQKTEIYISIILSISISLFLKNSSEKFYEVGDILQKNRRRYEIVEITDEYYKLRYEQKGTTTLITIPDKESIDKEYLKTTAGVSKRKVKTGFDQYRNLFTEIFETRNLPSEFDFKAVLIVEKKDFFSELKSQKLFPNIKLDKAIPFQWINKNGKFEKSNIDISPMIYLVPDYDTFEDYILNENIEIDLVVVIGKNKYQNHSLTKIKKDLRIENVPFSILVGSKSFEDENNLFVKWRWTPEEMYVLREIDKPGINTITINENDFYSNIKSLNSFFKLIKTKYSIELPPFSGIKQLLYALVLPQIESRMCNQIDYIRYLINKEFLENIKSEFNNQNIDPTEIILQVNDKVNVLFHFYENSKLPEVNKKEFDFLVVPNRFEDVWKNETNLKILSFKKLSKKIKDYTTVKSFLFISPFGYGLSAEELLFFCRNTKHNFNFLCFPEEALVIKTLNEWYQQNVSEELSSSSRKKLSGIEFPIIEHKPESEDISELIGRISDKERSNIRIYAYDNPESINYKIEYQNGEPHILAGNKSVLHESKNNKRKVLVCNLKNQDQIRVYSNLSKEILFETASKQDKNGRLSEIDNHVHLWKKCLSEFFNNKGGGYLEENLLIDLRKNGASITSPFTLKNWLDKESNVRFPQKNEDIYAISKCVNNPILTNHLASIIKSKETYNGLMIALGRDLSDEVMDYIINKNKGSILSTFSDEEIVSIANTSAPLQTIRNISITEEYESE